MYKFGRFHPIKFTQVTVCLYKQKFKLKRYCCHYYRLIFRKLNWVPVKSRKHNLKIKKSEKLILTTLIFFLSILAQFTFYMHLHFIWFTFYIHLHFIWFTMHLVSTCDADWFKMSLALDFTFWVNKLISRILNLFHLKDPNEALYFKQLRS